MKNLYLIKVIFVLNFIQSHIFTSEAAKPFATCEYVGNFPPTKQSYSDGCLVAARSTSNFSTNLLLPYERLQEKIPEESVKEQSLNEALNLMAKAKLAIIRRGDIKKAYGKLMTNSNFELSWEEIEKINRSYQILREKFDLSNTAIFLTPLPDEYQMVILDALILDEVLENYPDFSNEKIQYIINICVKRLGFKPGECLNINDILYKSDSHESDFEIGYLSEDEIAEMRELVRILNVFDQHGKLPPSICVL